MRGKITRVKWRFHGAKVLPVPRKDDNECLLPLPFSHQPETTKYLRGSSGCYVASRSFWASWHRQGPRDLPPKHQLYQAAFLIWNKALVPHGSPPERRFCFDASQIPRNEAADLSNSYAIEELPRFTRFYQAGKGLSTFSFILWDKSRRWIWIM